MCKFFIIHITLFIILCSQNLSEAYEDSQEKRLNLWPFVFYSKDKTTNSTRVEVLGPFYQKYTFPQENGTSLRPFISVVTISKARKAFFLSPLGTYRSDEEISSFKLIPLIDKTWYKNDPSYPPNERFTFFIVFTGKTENNETYGGVFPLYGKFKDRFGAREISFFLWPLYTKTTYEEHINYNILWPFIKITKPTKSTEKHEGQDHYKGFKLWPLYGSFIEGPTKRYFILWPFYIKEHSSLSQEEFSEKTVVFPFYISEKTETHEKKIVLWPFFQKIDTYDRSYHQVDILWPFYRKIEGKEITGRRWWPLYGYVKRSDSLDIFSLWPLYFYKYADLSNANQTYLEKEHRFLLLSKFREIQEKENISKEILLWPLFYSYEVYSKAHTKPTVRIWYLPSLLPLFDEGLERNYGCFFKLIEYHHREDYKFLKVFWGLYRYERNKDKTVQELGFVIRLVRGQDTSYVEFLEGLLGIGKIENITSLKIFYIPVIKQDRVDKIKEKEEKFHENSHISWNL